MTEHDALAILQATVEEVRANTVKQSDKLYDKLSGGEELDDGPSSTLANLCHYLALRQHDLRPMQRELMALGLSSLGRLESRVLPTVDAVLASIAALRGQTPRYDRPTKEEFFRGEAALATCADQLLGSTRDHRRGRIMITLPKEAAETPDMLLDLARRGMDIARINCAHDDSETWAAMADHARAAGREVGRDIKILMDIAGPKIRTEQVISPDRTKLTAGDRLRLVSGKDTYKTEDVQFCAAVSLEQIIARLQVGHHVGYNDGKMAGEVESVGDREVVVLVTHTKAGGCKLKPEKGLNFPDTDLGLAPLTEKDRSDLEVVVRHADMIGYSFISRPDDIDLLEAALADMPEGDRRIGFVAKIEQPAAVANLPLLIGRAKRFDRPFGVMIARGDLAAEIGFERVAEMQEEILWVCEAAAVPTIWATQVLEDLVKTGVPSRGEMTDAAMAARAECVMLNKGPAIGEAVSLLDRLFARMDGHVFKKTPTLRRLQAWQEVLD